MKHRLARCYTSSSFGYYLVRPWCYIHDMYHDIKAVIQRGLRGYADCDVWSLDSYLSHILIHAVRDLQGGMGWPAQYKITYKEWQQILKDISDGFEIMKNIDDEFDKVDTKEAFDKIYKKAKKKEDRSFDLLKAYFHNLWD